MQVSESIKWHITYRDFFLRKIRRLLLPRMEAPAGERPMRLFTLDNDVLSAHIRAGGAYEPEVLGIIDRIVERHALSSGIALDVGANIGNHALWLAQRFVRVVAFEPNDVMVAALQANCLLNEAENVSVQRTALGASAGVGLLEQQSPGHMGTLELMESAPSPQAEAKGAYVPLQRGDDVLGKLAVPLESVRFIKIDVEGSELPALKGLSATIELAKPVICFEARNPTEGQSVRAELNRLGYTHFYQITSSRLSFSSLLKRPLSGFGRKHYSLSPIDTFKHRHYSAVFCWNRPLA